jgi:hypothetical protein
MQPPCAHHPWSVYLNVDSIKFIIPAIVVVPIDVEDFLAFDGKDAV